MCCCKNTHIYQYVIKLKEREAVAQSLLIICNGTSKYVKTGPKGDGIMKKRKVAEPFIDQLKRSVRSLKKMRPGEVHVFSINANYGHYQIVVGSHRDAVKRRYPGKYLPIEINGEIHHLFISPHAIRIHPSKTQMLKNLNNTVIVRDVAVHIRDPKGDGRHVVEQAKDVGVRAREYINLAGVEGQKLLEETHHKNRLTMAAYRIIQKDIIESLRQKKEMTEESKKAAD